MRNSRKFAARAITLAMTATSILLASAGLASAADVHVETTGTDSPTCGAIGSPCLTVAQATTNAVNGDTVMLGAGSFTLAATITPGAKSLSYVGAGSGSTTITANNSQAIAGRALFRLNTTGTTYSFSDMTLTGFPSNNGSNTRFGIWIQPTPTSTTATIDTTIDNVVMTGLGNSFTQSENAVYAVNNNGSLSITDSEITDVMGNSILLESQIGAVTVTGTTISKPSSSTGSAIFDMIHGVGATVFTQTGLHDFSDNVFNTPSAISVVGGWAFGTSPIPGSFPVGVTISGNEFNAGAGSSNTVTLINADPSASGTAGQIDNAAITGNTFTGTGNMGVSLQGGIPDADISGNNIRGRTTGVSLTRWTAGYSGTTWAHKPDGAVVSGNQIVDNTAGVATDSGVTVTATLNGNWWGCNAGPEVGASPPDGDCDTVSTFDAGALTLDNWVVLGISASPTTLAADGSATVTAGFALNNLGGAAPQVFADGTILPMGSTGGSLTTVNPALSASTATNTFTSNAATNRTASASMDHQSVTWAWADVQTSPPVITVISPAPNSVVTASSTTINYTVNEPSTCSPPSGSSVPLAVGVNTIVITCVNANGQVATATVTVTRPDALPTCAKSVAITNVTRSGSRTKISGIARLQYAGQRISVFYEPSGSRVIARPVVQADGTWRTVVSRPSRPSYTSNQARYRARLSKTYTPWTKLTRRMGATAVSSLGGGRLKVTGNVSLPVAKGQPLRVERSDACGNYRQVGWLRVWGSGSFSGTVSDGGVTDSAVFIRLKVKVTKSSNRNYRFNTYSIVQPVVIQP